MEKQIYDLKAMYFRMWECFINKDKQIFDEIFADSFTLTHMTGLRQNKDLLWNDIINGQLNYYSQNTETIDVTVNSDTAELVGKTKVMAAVYGGRKTTYRLQQDMTLIYRNEKWQFSQSIASMY